MRWIPLVTVVVAVVLEGCTSPGGPGGPGVPGDPGGLPGPGMLPAWRTSRPEASGRASALLADPRAAAPRLYAITEPPSRAGFRSFVEWEPMRTVLLSYIGYDILGGRIVQSMTDMVRLGVEAVEWTILVPDGARQGEFLNLLRNAGVPQSTLDAKVGFVTRSANSIWMIDFGPFPLVEPGGTVAFADFRYYDDRPDDDSVPTLLGNLWGATTYRAPLDLEGGNFASDGNGTCFTTQRTFQRNADKTEAQVRDVFRQYLGCRSVVVLIPEEDRTGHIDMFSKLAAPNVFVLGKSTTTNSLPKTVQDLESNASILQAAILGDGSRLTVLRIPMPYQLDGVWRTYTNSTFANGVNLVPVYPEFPALEAEAMAVWHEALPDWTHVGIDSDAIITLGGAMHCISRQVPQGAFASWVPDGRCEGARCLGPVDGYDGACEEDADCRGPRWLCPLNDCPCEPACPGRECGGDGCGGSCGTCDAGSACDDSGACVPAAPDGMSDDMEVREDPEDVVDVPATELPRPDAPTTAEPLPDALLPDADLPDALLADADLPEDLQPETGLPETSRPGADAPDASPVDEPLDEPEAAGRGTAAGGCLAAPGSRTAAAPVGLVLGIMALLVFRLVYTTARE